MTDASTQLTRDDVFFPNGIPGFENERRYRLSHSDTEAGRVYWMESLDNPDITFTLVDPQLYGLNYVLELTDEEQRLLQADCPEQVVVLLMLWKPEEPQANQPGGLNANIGGPILINVEQRLGMQKLLTKARMEVNIIDDPNAI